MPRMTQKRKQELTLFLNERDRVEYNNNVMNQGKRRVRGFWGIEPLVKVFP